VDGSPAAIEILRSRASNRGVTVDMKVADLEKFEFQIEPASWNLIAICYYLQRDLFAPAKQGVVPGGILISIVHITEPEEEEPMTHRLRPGELERYFQGWEILHRHEGKAERHGPSTVRGGNRRATPSRFMSEWRREQFSCPTSSICRR